LNNHLTKATEKQGTRLVRVADDCSRGLLNRDVDGDNRAFVLDIVGVQTVIGGESKRGIKDLALVLIEVNTERVGESTLGFTQTRVGREKQGSTVGNEVIEIGGLEGTMSK
jgi:hypothetical protein